jgi:hypothetical protein
MPPKPAVVFAFLLRRLFVPVTLPAIGPAWFD